jgi:hypothetical protein
VRLSGSSDEKAVYHPIECSFTEVRRVLPVQTHRVSDYLLCCDTLWKRRCSGASVRGTDLAGGHSTDHSVIRAATKKPILMIAGVLEDTYVPGAVTRNAYEVDTITGKRTPQYIRTDLVSVYMRYTDRSHVDVYSVRKTQGGWKIEAKKDWFL